MEHGFEATLTPADHDRRRRKSGGHHHFGSKGRAVSGRVDAPP